MTLTDKARDLAKSLHAGHTRRSGASFFNAHLDPVARKVASRGGSDLAVASAYLHDAPEDIGEYTRNDIADLSPEILIVVDQLTEVGNTWQERKDSYLAKVAGMYYAALLISLCDKIVTGYDFINEWSDGNFGKRPDETLWFYDELTQRYQARAHELEAQQILLPSFEELSGVLAQMKALRHA